MTRRTHWKSEETDDVDFNLLQVRNALRETMSKTITRRRQQPPFYIDPMPLSRALC